MTREQKEQEALHESIANWMKETGYLEEGEILSGWVICYETTSSNNQPTCGRFYGPGLMTSWRALGLVEWVRQFCLGPYDGDDGDE